MRNGVPYSYQQLHSIFSGTIKSVVLREKTESLPEAKLMAGVDVAYIRALADGTASLDALVIPQTAQEFRDALRPHSDDR